MTSKDKDILLCRIWRPSFCDEVDKVKGWATMIKTPKKEIFKDINRSYPPSTPTSSGDLLSLLFLFGRF